VKIRFRKVLPGAIQPVYQRDGDSGMDLHACIHGTLAIMPGETRVVPTGIAIELVAGLEGQVRGRSGHTKAGKVVRLGTIDSNYRGPIGVICANASSDYWSINPGDRIAQLVIAPVTRVELQLADDELSETERGANGFGSTGQ
jgi:dUTP pyrophosphatase